MSVYLKIKCITVYFPWVTASLRKEKRVSGALYYKSVLILKKEQHIKGWEHEMNTYGGK